MGTNSALAPRAAPISNPDHALACAWAAVAPGRGGWGLRHVQCGPHDDDPDVEWFVVAYPGHQRRDAYPGYQPSFTLIPEPSGWRVQDDEHEEEHYPSLRHALFAICALAPCQEEAMDALAAEWLARGDLLKTGRL